MADRRVNSCRLVYVHTVSIQVRVRVLSVSVAGLEVVAVSRSEGDFKNMQTAETENWNRQPMVACFLWATLTHRCSTGDITGTVCSVSYGPWQECVKCGSARWAVSLNWLAHTTYTRVSESLEMYDQQLPSDHPAFPHMVKLQHLRIQSDENKHVCHLVACERHCLEKLFFVINFTDTVVHL